MRILYLSAFVPLLVSVTAWGQDQPTVRQFDIPTLEKLGRDMYAQDQAAWRATDALFGKHSKAELEKEKLRGWIVINRPEGVVVRFIRDGASGPEAAYDISNLTGAPVVSVPDNRQLTDEEKALFGARSLAVANARKNCAERYNTIVLKDPAGEGWLAWALAATTDPDLVVTLGHVRVTVSPDGVNPVQVDVLSRSCGAMKMTNANGERTTAIGMTQLGSDLPLETYVFLSLQHHLPFYVGTPDKAVWAVENGKIRKVEKPDSR